MIFRAIVFIYKNFEKIISQRWLVKSLGNRCPQLEATPCCGMVSQRLVSNSHPTFCIPSIRLLEPVGSILHSTSFTAGCFRILLNTDAGSIRGQGLIGEWAQLEEIR